jgi:hypothetical protein
MSKKFQNYTGGAPRKYTCGAPPGARQVFATSDALAETHNWCATGTKKQCATGSCFPSSVL